MIIIMSQVHTQKNSNSKEKNERIISITYSADSK